MLIDEYSCALFSDDTQGHMKLVVTITPHRVEDIAGRTLGMDANHGGTSVDVAQGQCERSLRFFCVLVGVNTLEG
jgi:hypothetical protein